MDYLSLSKDELITMLNKEREQNKAFAEKVLELKEQIEELEEQVEYVENENEELQEQVESLESEIDDLKYGSAEEDAYNFWRNS